jgi:excisionase family DNA binding protein
MGSIFEWITLEKAAETLQISKRQIYKYIEKNQLSALQEGKVRLVSRKDVKALADCKHKGISRVANGLTVARIDAEVQMLRKQVDALMRLNNIRYEPLDLDAKEMANLHDMAAHNLRIPWSPHEETMWCDVFVRLRLEDLEKLSQVEGYEDAWRPFLALSKAMYDTPHNSDNKFLLASGKENIERLSFVWSQKLDNKDSRQFNKLAERDDVLGRRVSRKVERIQISQNSAPTK